MREKEKGKCAYADGGREPVMMIMLVGERGKEGERGKGMAFTRAEDSESVCVAQD